MAKPPKIVVESPVDREVLTQALSDDEGDSSFFTSCLYTVETRFQKTLFGGPCHSGPYTSHGYEYTPIELLPPAKD